MKKSVASLIVGGAMIVGGTGTAILADQAISSEIIDTGTTYMTTATSTVPDAGGQRIVADKAEPKVTMDKWNGGVSAAVKYEDMQATGNRPFLSSNIEYDDGTQKMQVVQLEKKQGQEDGGVEINLLFNSKPPVNEFVFSISNYENLEFCYQPKVNIEVYLAQTTPFQDWCDPAWVKANYDPNMKVPLMYGDENSSLGATRSPDIVGSYAVYYKDHQNHVEGTTNYATGKFQHIKRPQSTDGQGNKSWGTLEYDGQGHLIVKNDQNVYDDPKTDWSNFLLDPTFGFTSVGASHQSKGSSQQLDTCVFTSTEAGTITSITANWQTFAAGNAGNAVYADSSGAPGAKLAEDSGNVALVVNSTDSWYTTNLSLSISATTYFLALWQSNAANQNAIAYDAGATNQNATKTATFETYPDPFGVPTGQNARKVSVYATYTASAVATNRSKVIVNTGNVIITGAKVIQ